MTLDLKTAQELLIRAVENSPRGKRNPVDPGEGICTYQSEDDPNDHCIVGQVLLDAGLDLPESNVGFYSVGHLYVERGEMTDLAKDFLTDCQSVFDHGATPPTWRQALAACRSEGYLKAAYTPDDDRVM